MADPVPSSQASATVRLNIPSAVAGFPFGIDAAEFIARCEGSGGEVLDAQRASAYEPEVLTCTEPAVDPPFPVYGVFAVFCGAEACEYILGLRLRDVLRVQQLLEDRYGSSATQRTGSECSHSTLVRWSDTLSELELKTLCTASGPVEATLTYSTGEAAQLSRRYRAVQQQNY